MSTLKFKLSLAAKPADVKIKYQQKLMLIGSCFTENMGAKLRHHLFETLENPHGILFNPVSVHHAIIDYIELKKYTHADLFKLNEIWNSWNHHSKFSSITEQEAIDKINTSIEQAHHFLKSADHLIITLGSAWLYALNENAPNGNGMVVANNHKAPSNWFTKKLMKSTELLADLQSMVDRLKLFNPNLNIVFTISPVRHLREGLVENNRSKAVLIQAVHEIVEQESNLGYFPAYEYVIDDLRDYRFYAEDLVHPNYSATNYVWEQFVETYMEASTQQIMKQLAEMQLAIQHKPFFTGSVAHQQFIHTCIDKCSMLMKQYPFLALQNHLQFFKSQIGK